MFKYTVDKDMKLINWRDSYCSALDDSSTIMCQRLLCPVNDIDCLLNKTKSVQWEFIALPTIPYVEQPITLMQLRSVGSSVFPNISFLIISGNDDGIFDVTDHGDADEAGKEN